MEFLPPGLDFLPPDLDFLPTGLDFLPPSLEFLPSGLEPLLCGLAGRPRLGPPVVLAGGGRLEELLSGPPFRCKPLISNNWGSEKGSKGAPIILPLPVPLFLLAIPS